MRHIQMNPRTLLRRLLTVGVALSVLAVIACSPGAAPAPSAPTTSTGPTPAPAVKRGGVATVFWNRDFSGKFLDPNKTSAAIETPLILPLFNGLIRYDPLKGTELAPDLAKSWRVSDDGKTYVFTLRDDAKFHDGTPVTAEDVEFTLKRLVGDYGATAKGQRIGNYIKEVWGGVEITGKNEVTVRTTQPSSSFLSRLGTAFVGIVPKHALENTPDKVFGDKPIGAGPFTLKQWTKDTVWEYEAFPGYVTSYREGEKLPYLDGLRNYIIGDTSAQLAAFQSGQVMIWSRTPSMDAKTGQAIKSFLGNKVVLGYYPDQTIIKTPLNSIDPLFKDPRVIKAFWVASDRKKINDLLFEGNLLVGAMLDKDAYPAAALPLDEVYTYPGMKEPDYALAKKLLAEAGFPTGIDVEFITRTGSYYVDAAQILIDGYANAGIRVKHTVLDTAGSSVRTNGGNWQVQSITGIGSTGPHPIEVFAGNYLTGGSSNSGIGAGSDPKLDQLIRDAEATIDPVQQGQRLREVQRYMYSTMSAPGVPIGNLKAQQAYWAYVKGYGIGVSSFESLRHDVTWLDR